MEPMYFLAEFNNTYPHIYEMQVHLIQFWILLMPRF